MNFKNLKRAFIISEIGVNHNGSYSIACKLIKQSIFAGANAVKFQLYKTESLTTKNAPKAKYQVTNLNKNETHFEMLKKYEISKHFLIKIIKFCKKNKIEFLCTPYDVDSAKILIKNKVNIIKTASADLFDHSIHNYLSEQKKISVIVSTGMSNLEQVIETISIYKKNKFNTKKLSILHCVSNYPSKLSSQNLRSINILKKLGITVGYSDHTNTNHAAMASISLGAKIIEKHFTLNKNLEGPDHLASYNFEEFKKYIKDIRNTEKVLGNEIKKKQEEENEMFKISVKGTYAYRNLNKNKKLEKKDFINLRPNKGIRVDKINNYLNKRLNKAITKGMPIYANSFKK